MGRARRHRRHLRGLASDLPRDPRHCRSAANVDPSVDGFGHEITASTQNGSARSPCQQPDRVQFGQPPTPTAATETIEPRTGVDTGPSHRTAAGARAALGARSACRCWRRCVASLSSPVGDAVRVVVGGSGHDEGGSAMSTTTTALERYQPALTRSSSRRWSGSWPATGASPATRTRWICASSPPGAQHDRPPVRCPPRRHRMLRPPPRRRTAGHEPRSPGGCARSSCFYRYAEEEGLIEHSPAVHVRRPRLDYESHVARPRPQRGRRDARRRRSRRRPRPRPDLAAGAERAAGLRSDRRRHRRPRPRTWPSHPHRAPQGRQDRHHAARATHRPSGRSRGRRTRSTGPIFVGADGRRLDRHAAGRIVRRIARRAGIAKRVGPHTLRHAFITAALDAGVPLRDVQEAASHADPRTTMRYDRAACRSTDTPPTSSPPSSPAPPAEPSPPFGAPD